jgi:hypothetical protein
MSSAKAATAAVSAHTFPLSRSRGASREAVALAVKPDRLSAGR